MTARIARIVEKIMTTVTVQKVAIGEIVTAASATSVSFGDFLRSQ